MVPARKAQIVSVLAAPFLRVLKWFATQLPLNRQAALVAHLLPRRWWYRAALRCSTYHGRLIAAIGGNGPLTRDLMLGHWLRQLSFSGKFPIPHRITGVEILRAPGPKLYTWTHLPLTEIPLVAVVHSNLDEPTVVADPGKIIEGNRFLVFGGGSRLPAIPTDRFMLGRVRETLRAGRSIVFLSDPYLGGPLSDVPLRMAARLKVPIVMLWAELQTDGVMEITLRWAPQPVIHDAAGLAENLSFLREHNQRILGELGLYT